ncbi:MAG: hypothetical protein PHN54_03405 [Bacilli bacterium]|nr:hypothetical protein [Bacilli bacterium]
MKFIKKILFISILVIPFFIGMKEVDAQDGLYGWRIYDLTVDSYCIKGNKEISSSGPSDCNSKGGVYFTQVNNLNIKFCIKDNKIVLDESTCNPEIDDSKIVTYCSIWYTKATNDATVFEKEFGQIRQFGPYLEVDVGQSQSYKEECYLKIPQSSNETYPTCKISGELPTEEITSDKWCPKGFYQIGESVYCYECKNYAVENSDTVEVETTNDFEKQFLEKQYYSPQANADNACYISYESTKTKVCPDGYYYRPVEFRAHYQGPAEGCFHPTDSLKYQRITVPYYPGDDSSSLKYGGFFDYFKENNQRTCLDGQIRKGAYCYDCTWVAIDKERVEVKVFDCGILSDFFNIAWFYILIAAPILTILFSAFDLFKAVAAGEEKVMKKQFDRIVKRLMLMIVVIILPVIVNMVIGLTGFNKLSACIDVNKYKLELQEIEPTKVYTSYCKEERYLAYNPFQNKIVCYNFEEDAIYSQYHYDFIDNNNEPTNRGYTEPHYKEVIN